VTRRGERILGELADALDHKRRLPVVRAADAEAACSLLHSEIDRATDARARVAAASGHPVACHDGCAQCCHNIPAVFAGEALTIARWLDRPENAAARAGFLARYPAWFERVADLAERWDAAVTAEDVEAGTAVATEAWRRQVMCAFNQDGRCTIYPVRPGVCRTMHALDTADNCAPDAAASPRKLPFAPLEEFMQRTNPVVIAMHAALRGDVRSQLVCVAVRDALAHGRGSK
jgi:hypothetical protein